MSESFRTTSNLLILVDFTILTFAGQSQPPGDENVKINLLAAVCDARWMLKQVQHDDEGADSSLCDTPFPPGEDERFSKRH